MLISIGRTPENEISCRAIQKKGNESFAPTTYELSAELLRKNDRRAETKTINSWELAHNRLYMLISIGRTPENEISCRAIQKKGNESFAPTTYEFTAELLRKRKRTPENEISNINLYNKEKI